MSYKATITSTTTLETTGTTATNVSGTLFITSNAAFKSRTQEYSTMAEVRADDYISTTSNAYAGLLSAFKQPGCAVPILLGRRQIDDITLTPTTVTDNADYEFTVAVYDEDTLETENTYVVSIDSGDTATATSIATALQVELSTTLAAENISVTDNSGSLTLAAASGYDLLLSSLTKLTDTYTTSEDAATLFAAIEEENDNDWYFLTCDDHDDTFVLAMAEQVESTESDDYPKQYRVSTADTGSIVALPDPATDLLGKLAALEYTRTAGEWHHNADSIFPEVAACAYQGQFDAGSTTWKFMNNENGVVAAQNPTTGKNLSTSAQGYIRARNASWVGEERGVSFMHGGTMAIGTSVWIDVLRGKDWINSEIETNLLDLLLNADKIAFTTSGTTQVKDTITGVLSEAVERNILSGFEEVSVPSSISFSDQVARILDDVEWTGYLAGAIHFIIVNGTLTYSDDELS